MLVRLHTHPKGNEFMVRRSCFRLASINQIRSWTTNGVFDYIRQKGCSHQRNGEPEKADVEFVCGWAGYNGPEEKDERRKDGGVDDAPCCHMLGDDRRK